MFGSLLSKNRTCKSKQFTNQDDLKHVEVTGDPNLNIHWCLLVGRNAIKQTSSKGVEWPSKFEDEKKMIYQKFHSIRGRVAGVHILKS